MSQPADDTLNTDYEQLASDLAAKKAEDELFAHPNAPFSKKTLIERYKQALMEEFLHFRKQQASGAEQLATVLDELFKENPDLATEELDEGLDRLATLSDKIEANEAIFSEKMAQGHTLQDFGQIDDNTLEVLYTAATRLLDRDQFDGAADAFSFLLGINPQMAAFWLGLGAAEYNRGHFKEALAAYTKAIEATPYDPATLLTISRCYTELGELNKAIDTLDETLTAIDESQQFLEWKEDIQAEKQHLTQLLQPLRRNV